jgi:hypothetical protein
METAPHHRLVGCGHRVGHDGELRELQPAAVLHHTEPAARDLDELGEATVHVVAGHELRLADVAPAALAQVTGATGNDRRDDDLGAPEVGVVPSGLHHLAGDLVPQGHWKGLPRGNPVPPEPDVRVAHTAPRHPDHDLVRTRCRIR